MPEYKGLTILSKKYQRGAAGIAAALVLMLGIFGMPVRATQETQQKLDAAKQLQEQTQQAIDENAGNMEAMQSAIGQMQGELGELNRKLSTLSGEISALDGSISDKQTDIALIEEEIRAKEEEIQKLQEDLEQAIALQNAQYEAMKKRVQYLYEKGQGYYLEILFGSSSLSDFFTVRDYMNKISEYDTRMMETYEREQEEIEEKQAILAKEQEELTRTRQVLKEEQSDLQGLKDSHLAKRGEVTGLLTQTAGQVQLTQAQVDAAEENARALEEQLAEQNSQVSALEAQLAEERRLAELSAATAWRDISQLTYDEGDRYLLANLIYCEAGNQPYEGQVAVGAVVINRVMSGAFPDTISGVIYQNWQFEPAMTGRLALALARDDATPSCYQAADAAMAGQTTVADCIFFRTPIPEITPRYVIGGHIFY